MQKKTFRLEAARCDEAARLPLAIRFIAEDWKTKMLKVDANLVRATGVKERFDQRCAI